jgi:hypothetical protein
VQSGASLSGSGVVRAISGAGSINPGNSPGILTAPAVDPSGGLSFDFKFTGLDPAYFDASSSGNDVLRLTDLTAAGGLSARTQPSDGSRIPTLPDDLPPVCDPHHVHCLA